MAPVMQIRPMADGTLIAFFMNAEMGLMGKRLSRVEAAHADLLACFTAHLPDVLPESADRREADDRPEAAARVAPPEVILQVLPFFLDEQQWHGADLQDRRVRYSLSWGLAQWVARDLGLQGSESYEAVRAAVSRSARNVRRVKADAARQDLEERGLIPPELQALLRNIDARRASEAETPNSL
ncbi:MAG: hypothetical protein ABWZ77_02430 [Naasia sp.]